jgi:hypothetical protein
MFPARLAVDAAFAAVGIPGCAYTPPGGGAAIPCVLIRDEADREFGGIAESRMLARGDILRVRSSEVPSPVKNGTFVAVAADAIARLGAATLKIAVDPIASDQMRLVWRCTVA